MRFAPGTYHADLPTGRVTVIANTQEKLGWFERWIQAQKPTAVGRDKEVAGMAQYRSVLRPITGTNSADGPWTCVTTDITGADFNYTLTIASISAALDQAKADGAAILTANGNPAVKEIVIISTY